MGLDVLGCSKWCSKWCSKLCFLGSDFPPCFDDDVLFYTVLVGGTTIVSIEVIVIPLFGIRIPSDHSAGVGCPSVP